jgi:hypothetical protein
MMNEYEVTFSSGEVVQISAWTPEAAEAIAEEEADDYGCAGQGIVRVQLLSPQQAET